MENEKYSIRQKKEGGEFKMIQTLSTISIRTEKVLKELRLIVKRRISSSESRSLYPDLSEGKSYRIGGLKNLTTNEALGLILTFPRDSDLYSVVLLDISEKAQKYQYQGQWIKIQKLCELRLLDLQVYYLLESNTTEYEIFGNLIDIGLRRLKKIRIFEPKYPVIYPIRKRGYNDHGSRKDDSRWLPTDVFIGPNPIKRDRSERIGNIKKTLRNFLFG